MFLQWIKIFWKVTVSKDWGRGGAFLFHHIARIFFFPQYFSPSNYNILAAGGLWKASGSYDAGSPSFHLLACIIRKLKYILNMTFFMKLISTDAARTSHHKRFCDRASRLK